MTELELDRLMGKVLMDAAKLELACECPSDATFIPSPQHKKQVHSMLKGPAKWAKDRARPLWKLILRRAATALLILSIGLGSFIAVSPSARAAVVRWFTEWYETHIIYHFAGEQLQGGMPLYEITELPHGFRETDRFQGDSVVSLLYENGAGGMICLDYNHLQQGSVDILILKDNGVEEVTVNRSRGQLLIPQDPEGLPMITWIDERANIQFTLMAQGDRPTLLCLAESVQRKK